MVYCKDVDIYGNEIHLKVKKGRTLLHVDIRKPNLHPKGVFKHCIENYFKMRISCSNFHVRGDNFAFVFTLQ